jgi:endogenous inhibitor of DNA gyrase (YacG/DUF329 family)
MEAQGLAEWPRFPFCSERCKLIDLGRWLGESYGIPKEEAAGEAEGEAGAEGSDAP